MAKFTKQMHGHVNPIFRQEEISLIAALDKAQQSTTNSQILGRNGEKGIIDFLNRYLPNSFRTINGHFVTPSGALSPETDVMIVDSRYPLLSQNEDGSVIAMLHSVVATIEVKLSITKKEILKIRGNGIKITELNSEVFPRRQWGRVNQWAFAYIARIKLATIAKHFFGGFSHGSPDTQLYLLRAHGSDQFGEDEPLGAFMWLEGGDLPAVHTTLAPLSDFYYMLTQDLYYTISNRNFDFHDIGMHMMDYMNYGICPSLNRGT